MPFHTLKRAPPLMNAPHDPSNPASLMVPVELKWPLYLRRWGWGILIAGVCTGALIYLLADPDSAAGASVEMADARVYNYNVERMGGKAALYAVRFNQWMDGLWHGRSLGVTVAVVAMVLALLCFWLSGLMSEQATEDDKHSTQRGTGPN
jgi:hypothetical protein